MKKKLIVSALLLLSACSVIAQGINFEHTSWSETLKKARELNKPIFIDVYTTWCGPCKAMSSQIFPRKDVGTFFNKNFVNLKIDAEKGEWIEFSKKYGVKAYPTLLFINSQNEELIGNAVGAYPAAELIDVGSDMLKKLNGVSEASLADLETRFRNGDRSDEFIQQYVKRLKNEKQTVGTILEAYITQFSSKTPTPEQLFFIATNFSGDVKPVYDFLIKNYKAVEAALKSDGLAGAGVDGALERSNKSFANKVIKSKELSVQDKQLALNDLYADMRVFLNQRAEKKIADLQLQFYKAVNDSVNYKKAEQQYVRDYLLPEDKSSTIGREPIVLDKNAPYPVLSVDSSTVNSWCMFYAVKITQKSPDKTDKQLAKELVKKAERYEQSNYTQSMKNIWQYNLGEEKKATSAQELLVKTMQEKTPDDKLLSLVEKALQKMKSGEKNISGFSKPMAPPKKH